jgi:hypothetical protein
MLLRRCRRGEVVFLTSWYAQAGHGGFYQALAKGIHQSMAWT